MISTRATVVHFLSPFVVDSRKQAARTTPKLTNREQRRRAGIPDSDKRPWIIARPAAELRRREEILAKQQKEREEKERKEQADREREIHEWGSRAVHELRRMSRSDLDQLAGQYQSPRRRKPFDPPEVDEEP